MKSLLLVIDLQKGWRHPSATETAMLRTVELCKRFSSDMIHCCFRNDPNSLFHTQLGWKRFTVVSDTDQIPEMAELSLVQHWRTAYSCLTPEVTELVQQYDHVYIAGVFTDISVAVTAMGVFDLGVPVSIISDCVATLHGEEVHLAALKSLESTLGSKHMVHSSDVL